MNTRKYIAASMAACLIGLSGCINDLNVLPLDSTVVTADKAYTDAESYTKGLNKIYAVWALSGQNGASDSDISGLDAGNTALLRCWWTMQEQPTDECKNSSNDSWSPATNNMTWNNTKLEPIEGIYQRCMLSVSLTNEFLKNVVNAPAGVDQKSYAAQARFNRALAYYVLMDMFGQPPFITEANYSLEPAPLSRKDLFNWIESELTTIKGDLPVARSTYGRADQSVVDFLLARMYLNAKVYTGEERYSDCIQSCKNVIAAGYTLADKYADLFKADNGENPETRKEIIYPVIFDGDKTQSWGMAALIVGSRGKEVKLAADGVDSGWAVFRSTQNLVRLFDFTNNNEPKVAEILDSRGIFYGEGRSINITTSSVGTFETEGWGVHKFKNVTSQGVPGKNTLWVDTDFPMFRLGDVYLMYAESAARGGGEAADLKKGVDYVNLLRKRAFGDESRAINAAWLSANNFRNILDERGRELYWEGVRRTDLIRFDLFTSGSYTWPDKGGVITGVGVDKRYNLFPIPVTDLSVNGNLHQNEGY